MSLNIFEFEIQSTGLYKNMHNIIYKQSMSVEIFKGKRTSRSGECGLEQELQWGHQLILEGWNCRSWNT